MVVLLRLQLLQSLTLIIVAGEGDTEPGVVSIAFVVCPIQLDVTFHQCFCRQGLPTAVLRPRLHPRARQGSCWQGQRAAVFVLEVKINVSGHLVHIAVLSKLGS